MSRKDASTRPPLSTSEQLGEYLKTERYRAYVHGKYADKKDPLVNLSRNEFAALVKEDVEQTRYEWRRYVTSKDDKLAFVRERWDLQVSQISSKL